MKHKIRKSHNTISRHSLRSQSVKPVCTVLAWVFILSGDLFAQSIDIESGAGQTTEVELEKYEPGDGIRFSSKEGDQSIRLRGYVQAYSETRTTSEQERTETRYRIRRARLNLEGKAPRQKTDYRLRLDFAAAGDTQEGERPYNEPLLDAFIAYSPIRALKLSFGQRSTTTDNREIRIRSNSLQFAERSRLSSAFASIREFGFFALGRFKLGNEMAIKPGLAITTGDGQNAFEKNYGGYKGGARLDFLPFGYFHRLGEHRGADFVREFNPKLSLGVVYSYNRGITSRRGRESGTILYRDADGEFILPDYEKIGFDFLFKYSGFTILGEYVVANAILPDNSDDIVERSVDGGESYSTDFFRLPGVDAQGDRPRETISNRDYIKNQLFLGSGYNIQVGYLFENYFSVDLRYTHLEADEFSFLANTLFYSRPNYYTLGISKYFIKEAVKLQLSITYAEATKGSIRTVNGTEVNTGTRYLDGELLEADGEYYGRVLLQAGF